MKHTDVSTLVNNAYKQAVGAEDGILNEDLSNVVDAGNTIFNTTDKEIFTNALMDQVGRFVVDAKQYTGRFYGLLRDAFDYGILCKVRQTKLPEANVNETWGLEDAVSFDQDIFTQSKNIEAKFYQKQINFEIPISIVDEQLKEAFTGAEQLSSYVGMLLTNVESAMNLALTNLCRRTLNNHIGEVINAEGASLINLLDGFLTLFPGSSVTAADAIYDKDFLRYAAFVIGETYDRITDIGELYNLSGEDTWANEVNVVYLADFYRAMGVYLYDANGQLKDSNLKLPAGESTPYWQSQGDDGYALEDIAGINITTSEGNDVDTKTDGVYVLAAMFDKDACAISKLKRYATSHRNNRAEFTNTWNKMHIGCLNDFGKNFVVFIVKDTE